MTSRPGARAAAAVARAGARAAAARARRRARDGSPPRRPRSRRRPPPRGTAWSWARRAGASARLAARIRIMGRASSWPPWSRRTPPALLQRACPERAVGHRCVKSSIQSALRGHRRCRGGRAAVPARGQPPSSGDSLALYTAPAWPSRPERPRARRLLVSCGEPSGRPLRGRARPPPPRAGGARRGVRPRRRPPRRPRGPPPRPRARPRRGGPARGAAPPAAAPRGLPRRARRGRPRAAGTSRCSSTTPTSTCAWPAS